MLPATGVLVMTAYPSPDNLLDAVKAGAAGYVFKAAPFEQLVDAIRRTIEGDFPLDRKLTMKLLRHLIAEVDRQTGLFPRRNRKGSHTASGYTGRTVGRQGDRGIAAARPGQDEPGDLSRTVDQPLDGQDPRAPHHHQARGLRPHPGSRPGRPTRSALRAKRLSRADTILYRKRPLDQQK